MNKGVSLALVGASGVVGTKIIQLLEKRAFPLDKFIPLGNSTVGSSIQFNNQKYQVESLQNFSPEKGHLHELILPISEDMIPANSPYLKNFKE